MKKLYGVITAMTTPFDEAGQVDVKALAAQAARATEQIHAEILSRIEGCFHVGISTDCD